MKQPFLKDNAEEFLLKARATLLNYDLKEQRFVLAKRYFEQSLASDRNIDNIFAYFLHNHNQFNQAEPLYQEALDHYRTLADTNPQSYLPDVAMTLNNLANLQRAKNEYGKAEKNYIEALDHYQTLADTNPQTYLPDVAITLNNLGILQSDKNEYGKAEKNFQEVLDIRRTLADTNPQTYLPYVGIILKAQGKGYWIFAF